MSNLGAVCAALKEGVDYLQQQLAELETQNRHLRARQESLEQQVMDLTREPLEQFWGNVIILEGEGDEPKFDSAA